MLSIFLAFKNVRGGIGILLDGLWMFWFAAFVVEPVISLDGSMLGCCKD